MAVAWSGALEEPGIVLGRTVPSGCGTVSVHHAAVGAWKGLAAHYPDCADGTAEDDVALTAGSGSTGSTVWVQVRSVQGRPDLAATLGTLDVTP